MVLQYVLPQTPSLHTSVLLGSPGHVAPFPSGVGVSHTLVNVCDPAPQVEEHPPEADHALHPPSTDVIQP